SVSRSFPSPAGDRPGRNDGRAVDTFPTGIDSRRLMELPRPRLTFAERLYLPQILGGLAVTTRHFVRNLSLHVLHVFGLARDKRASVTTQYPEERKVYSEGYRGSHRLTL